MRVLRLEVFGFPYTMFTLQTSFKPLLLGGGGGGEYNTLVEAPVNRKEEKSQDFCPNYV